MNALSASQFESWLASDGPVAITMRETLLPVEGAGSVFFPSTYAATNSKNNETSYNIDELPDGTKVVLVDSVGSQANRIEPLFGTDPDLMPLIPQIYIEVGKDKTVSLLEAGHRLGDALVRSTNLGEKAQQAFQKYQSSGDCSDIAYLAPTSLIFGVWDSRDTHAKLPRLVQSVIRAWDVNSLTRSAQYFPPVDYAALGVFSEEVKDKSEKDAKSKEAQRGFVAIPATKTHGGVVAKGPIYRDVTINLVALRRITAKANKADLQRYLLGLTLAAATAPQDGYIRQGCLLVLDPEHPASWNAVYRSGQRKVIQLEYLSVLDYANQWAKAYRALQPKVPNNENVAKPHDEWPNSNTYLFNIDKAKKDIAKAASKKASAATQEVVPENQSESSIPEEGGGKTAPRSSRAKPRSRSTNGA